MSEERIVQEQPVEQSMEQQAPEEIVKSYNTYQMRPSLAESFQASKVKEIINEILHQKLKGKNYNPSEAGKLSQEISDEVNTKVKENVEMPRYKHVVQVTLGQQLGSGCRYIAKCCWDAECDSYVSDIFSSGTMFCVCTVFGIYQY